MVVRCSPPAGRQHRHVVASLILSHELVDLPRVSGAAEPAVVGRTDYAVGGGAGQRDQPPAA